VHALGPTGVCPANSYYQLDRIIDSVDSALPVHSSSVEGSLLPATDQGPVSDSHLASAEAVPGQWQCQPSLRWVAQYPAAQPLLPSCPHSLKS
jgi:hypothetical protein